MPNPYVMPESYDAYKRASPPEDQDEMSDADKRDASYERGEAMFWDQEDTDG